jgi:N4-gp56 family major capsid protein
MADTDFPLGHPLAVQRWSTSLAVQAEKKQYFTKFMGTGEDVLIKIQKELEKKAGEKITVALRMKLAGDGIEGDNPIDGTSGVEALNFFNDALFIDQRRKGTKSKGLMSEQRVPYNLRKEGRDALSTWWAEDYDEQIMMYLAGARGVDTSFHVPISWTGRANNALQAPDSDHQFYGGNASGKADLDANDKMGLAVIDRLVAEVETLDPEILPFLIEGERRYVHLMHTFQAYDLRKSVSSNDWMDIHKNTDGKDSLIYKNALGEWNGVVLHKHRNVIRFSDYGTGGDVLAARSLFLGAQAAMIAWGGNGSGVGRYKWVEEAKDYKNSLGIVAGAIYGVKKARYNGKDFGVIAVDTACARPAA